MTFIHKHEVPQGIFKDVTYICFVCSVWTEKKEPNRRCATISGNLINYPDDVGTPTEDLLLIKILLNSVISTPKAQFANADISNFYLMMPLKRPEYTEIILSDIPEEVIIEYNLHKKATPEHDISRTQQHWLFKQIKRTQRSRKIPLSLRKLTVFPK